MAMPEQEAETPSYDRRLLLAGPKRSTVLALWEVQRYGRDSYGDPEYVSIYGMRPSEWYAKGARVLGRTAVECTRDPLYWLLRHQPAAQGLGFELDPEVFRLTRQNIATLALPIEIRNIDYRSGLEAIALTVDELLVAFIAPPWGDALDPISGLDLCRTTPPIVEIVDVLFRRFSRNRLLCAVQLHEIVDPTSLVEVAGRFDWSWRRTYAVNTPGQNHGIVVGTRGWAPASMPLG